MDAEGKLRLFAGQMDLEPAEEVSVRPAVAAETMPCGATAVVPAGRDPVTGRPRSTGREARFQAKMQSLGVFNAVTPNGTIPLLKTLLTSACERNCAYCPFRAGRTMRRETFTPDEMARAVDNMHRAGLVRGLFLSSGIIGGGARSQDKLLATVEILRRRYAFRGFVHLKIMPGAERAQVYRAMQLADRLSINLEAPTDRHLAHLAPMKQLEEELLRPLEWVEEIRRDEAPTRAWNGRWPSTTTQFVVGAAGESDVDLLSIGEHLYRRARLQRVYFSAFRPIKDTPLENQAATPRLREHRLYQASYLLRDYDFGMEEMAFDGDGNLALDVDPKLAYAQAHLAETPVELNRADRRELLRVPGIGPRSAAVIIRARRQGVLRDLRDLQRLGVSTKRLGPFVLLDGRRPSFQRALF